MLVPGELFLHSLVFLSDALADAPVFFIELYIFSIDLQSDMVKPLCAISTLSPVIYSKRIRIYRERRGEILQKT